MGGKFYGADVAELRRVADAFDKAAGDLNDATQTVTRSVQSTFWAGPVAVKFRTTWTEQHCMRLGSAREALREQAKQLRTQAQEQQDASRGDGAYGQSGGSGWSWPSDVRGWWNLASGAYGPISDLKTVISGSLKARKMIQWARGLSDARSYLEMYARARYALNNGVEAARSAMTLIPDGAVKDFGSLFGKVAPWTRALGVVGGAFMAIDGARHFISPDYDGWRRNVDKVMGGVGLVSGVATVAVLTGAITLGPVGLAAVAIGGLAVGAWQLGNYVYDNWDSISSWTGEKASQFTNWAGEKASAVTNTVGKAARGLAEGAKNLWHKVFG